MTEYEKNYSVVGINGFQKGSLTFAEAVKLSQQMRRQMKTAGWSGKVSIRFQDGSEVKLCRICGERAVMDSGTDHCGSEECIPF